MLCFFAFGAWGCTKELELELADWMLLVKGPKLNGPLVTHRANFWLGTRSTSEAPRKYVGSTKYPGSTKSPNTTPELSWEYRRST